MQRSIQLAFIQKKTLIVGVEQVLRPMRRSAAHFVKFLTQRGAPCELSDEDDNIIEMPFKMDKRAALQLIEEFIGISIQCTKCKTFETGSSIFSHQKEMFVCFHCGNHRIY